MTVVFKVTFMKSTIFKMNMLFVLVLLTGSLFAQPPGAFYLTGVAKDNQGNPARNRTIHYEVTVRQGTVTGTAVYQESHKVQSNNDGVYEVVVGRGIRNTGAGLTDSLSKIDWANGPYFLNQKIAIAPSIPAPWWIPANNFVDLGTQQILSAVYAIYAGNASVTNVTTNIAPGLPNTYLITDSTGKVSWTTPQAAQNNVTQVNIVTSNTTSALGADAEIGPNTSTVITLNVPQAKKEDAIVITALDDYVNWTVYSAWCPNDGEVKIRFGNFTVNKVNVRGSQYKIVIIK
jgi:hypothetical protein